MKVILKQDVNKLGHKGDLVQVSDGYARNFLFSKGLAEEGTPARIQEWNLQQKQLKAKEDKKEQAAQDLKKKIGGKRIVIMVNAGEEGRLFGSVTSQQVADALEQQMTVTVDKRDIKIDDSIRQLGVYSFKIRLYTGVEAELSLSVEAQ